MIKSLSIILQLYNEEKRLNNNFKKINNFLSKKKIPFIEIIFVDDGSVDSSGANVSKFIRNTQKSSSINIKLLKSKRNLGKGSALKIGVKKAKGQWILTSDIDFSVPIGEILNWQKKKFISEKNKVYFSSRSHRYSNVKNKFYRTFLGFLLSNLISFVLQIKIKDTQCGYKLYKKIIAKNIFSKVKSLKYEHDIEIVLICRKQKIKIIELPVKWNHVSQSKVNIFTDSFKILVSVFYLKYLYLN